MGDGDTGTEVTGALVGLVEGTAVVGLADGSGPTLGDAVPYMGDGVTGAVVTGDLVGRVDGTAEVEGSVSGVPGVVVGLTDGKVVMLGELLGSADGFNTVASVE
jgi:hypothetical protein